MISSSRSMIQIIATLFSVSCLLSQLWLLGGLNCPSQGAKKDLIFSIRISVSLILGVTGHKFLAR
ncbi:hypothetical protein JB92DRAFT_2855473 [Gautieria morchelliformis]|nr:hypothetical protein JB92DRAFT_2855473 [Gautieria morchelliformis]